MSAISPEKIRRELVRWLCLEISDQHRPEAVADAVVLAAIQQVYPDAAPRELRRELDYLRMRQLLTVENRNGDWWVALTYQGVDFVEYTSGSLPGIARPPLS